MLLSSQIKCEYLYVINRSTTRGTLLFEALRSGDICYLVLSCRKRGCDIKRYVLFRRTAGRMWCSKWRAYYAFSVFPCGTVCASDAVNPRMPFALIFFSEVSYLYDEMHLPNWQQLDMGVHNHLSSSAFGECLTEVTWPQPYLGQSLKHKGHLEKR